MKLRESKRGGLYRRADSAAWWMWYRREAGGPRTAASTGETDEVKAQAVLERVLAMLEVQEETGDAGPVTVGSYGRRWLKARHAAGIISARDDESRFGRWVEPSALAQRAIAEVRVRDVRAFMQHLQTQKGRDGERLAPRTVQHVYGLLRVLFNDAKAEELILANPCALSVRRKELPAKRDADPRWRAGAVFSHQEVELLLTADAISEDRRVLYALLALTGMRFGELADRTWADFDPSARPLGRLTVATSFSIRTRESKETKTGLHRLVPVHPTLARTLAWWRSLGWSRMLGRTPREDDVLIPSTVGVKRSVSYALKQFKEDLAALGLRERRIHDLRRTFISLALADGADGQLLRWVTHDPPRDQFSQYVSPPWPALCREVAKLRIPALGLVERGEEPSEERAATALLRSTPENENPAKSQGLGGVVTARSTGLEPVSPRAARAAERSRVRVSAGLGAGSRCARRRAPAHRSSVARPHRALPARCVHTAARASAWPLAGPASLPLHIAAPGVRP